MTTGNSQGGDDNAKYRSHHRRPYKCKVEAHPLPEPRSGNAQRRRPELWHRIQKPD